MAKVNIATVRVPDPNPAPFSAPFRFEITLECYENLQEDIEIKLVYVGSAESDDDDQVLESVFVGPLPEGRHMFIFESSPPDTSKIPAQEVVGVTVVLLTCSYRDQPFVKIGYYVKNFYADPEMAENPPEKPQFDQLQREIIVDQPRITKYVIKWDEETKQVQTTNGDHSGAAGDTLENGVKETIVDN